MIRDGEVSVDLPTIHGRKLCGMFGHMMRHFLFDYCYAPDPDLNEIKGCMTILTDLGETTSQARALLKRCNYDLDRVISLYGGPQVVEEMGDHVELQQRVDSPLLDFLCQMTELLSGMTGRCVTCATEQGQRETYIQTC